MERNDYIEDKYRRCLDRDMITWTNFLDPTEAKNAEQAFFQTKHLLYGGFEDAERRVMIFLPSYFDALPEEENPLSVLRCRMPKGSRPLTHRDYLGAILATGVDRSIVGDILVRPDGADILVLRNMTEYFRMNFTQAGHANLTTEILPVEALVLTETHMTEKKDTVASLRLDNLVGSAFNLSRTKAQDAIKGGLVFVNGLQDQKSDRILEEGDKLVLRGKGKAVLKEVGKTTKKDRIFIVWALYV